MYDPMMDAEAYCRRRELLLRHGWTGAGNAWWDPAGAGPFSLEFASQIVAVRDGALKIGLALREPVERAMFRLREFSKTPAYRQLMEAAKAAQRSGDR